MMIRLLHCDILQAYLSSVKIKLDTGKMGGQLHVHGDAEGVMIFLISGLALFFAAHFYSAFRSRLPEKDIKLRLGEGAYMGLYSLVSAVGLGLIVYGYWSAPAMDVLYAPPAWTHTVAKISMLVALVVVVSAYIPANHFRQWLRHPMILATGVWAGSHLILPTDAKELLVFGSFLLYAVADSFSAFRRPQSAGKTASLRNDAVVIILGAAIYAGLVLWLHKALFGVSVW